MLGPYGLLSRHGLTATAGVVTNGNLTNSDLIKQMIPWTVLDWTQVHHGVLPLWNPYSGLGLPLAFNWQSAAFGVPSLVGYLVPLRYAYTAGMLVTLLVAGTGTYVAARLLRLGLLGSAMAAGVFELSGPLIAWLGYPSSQVMSWGGWLLAGCIHVLGGNRRIGAITVLAIAIAGAVYAGFPETLVVLAVALLVFVVAVLASRSLPGRFGLARGPIARPALDLALAVLGGGALGAPLALPALQLTLGSIRTTAGKTAAAPAHDLLYLLFSAFDGRPVAGSYAFGGSFFYNETAAYLGVIALVLALVGVVVGIRRRRIEVVAVVLSGAAAAALVYVGPAAHLVEGIPAIGDVNVLRALMPLSLAVALLAGGVRVARHGGGARCVVEQPLGTSRSDSTCRRRGGFPGRIGRGARVVEQGRTARHTFGRHPAADRWRRPGR